MGKIKLYSIIILLALTLVGCSDDDFTNEEVNGQALKSLVDSALKGSIAANQRLSGLVDADKIIKEN